MTAKPSAAAERAAPKQAAGSERSKHPCLQDLDAVLLDLDGVITATAEVHAAAWKTAFDAYLHERAARGGGRFLPFDLKQDYARYVDGKPRLDGVASFLKSRGIFLPHGSDSDPPGKETICGLGNSKNSLFLTAVREEGVKPYKTSVAFAEMAKARGLKVAVVTSSRNGREILHAARLGDFFDAAIDGVVAREWKLEGKPAPDTYLEAARRLGVPPSRAAVVEDAVAGVAAGKAGGFGLVIGVDRSGQAELLRKAGADIVVSDLSEIDFADAEN